MTGLLAEAVGAGMVVRSSGVGVPDGFGITSEAYREFVRSASLRPFVADQIRRYRHGADLLTVGAAIRNAFAEAEMSAELCRRITAAYEELGGDGTALVVRSGVDPPRKAFFNVCNSTDLQAACKRCFAALFTDVAIRRREKGGIDHLMVATEVAVQRMVRSDLGGSGTVQVLDDGCPGRVRITAVWGLGDVVVGGRVESDEYLVFDTHRPIITRRRGTKETKVVCAGRGVKAVPASLDERQRDVLDDDEVLTLARRAIAIEQVYGPATIEWAKDERAVDCTSSRSARSPGAGHRPLRRLRRSDGNRPGDLGQARHHDAVCLCGRGVNVPAGA